MPEAGPDANPEVWVIVVAAGSGERFGGPKPYVGLGGRRVLDWSLADARSVADGVVLVVGTARLGDEEPDADVVVAGGTTRSGSVRCGLAAVPDSAELILVHDAARPLAGAALFATVVGVLRDGAEGGPADAVVPGRDVVDTLRRVAGGTVDRTGVVAVQTPQGFRADVLRRAHEGAPEGTDDASLVEAAGGRVVVVPGPDRNLKITRPDDLVVAEALLGER